MYDDLKKQYEEDLRRNSRAWEWWQIKTGAGWMPCFYAPQWLPGIEYRRDPAAPTFLDAEDLKTNMNDSVDMVHSPDHYSKQGDIECIEVLEQLAKNGHDFRVLQSIRYLWRYNKKHKDITVDLKKSIWYIERLLEELENDKS